MTINPNSQQFSFNFPELDVGKDTLKAELRRKEEKPIPVTVKNTFSTLGKLRNKIGKYFNREFVPVKTGGGKKLYVKVADLANGLGVTKSQIRKAAKNGTLEELIVDPQGEKELAKQESLEQAEASHEGFRDFILRNPTMIMSSDGAIEDRFTHEEAELIREVYKHAQLILDNPKLKATNAEAYLKLSPRITLAIKNEGTTLKVDLLCGKKLGSGSFGVAFRRINLLKHDFTNTVVKVAKSDYISMQAEAEKDLRNEVAMLAKIHEDGPILGIQEKLKAIQVGHEKVTMHEGPMYEGDLFRLVIGQDETPATKLNLEQKYSLAYQLLHGLAHVHSKGIAHGDLKLENIFFERNKDPDSRIDYMARIGDFGGARKQEQLTFENYPRATIRDGGKPYYIGHDPLYRTAQDDAAIYKAWQQGDLEKIKEIEKKADVLAIAKVIFEVVSEGITPPIPGIWKGGVGCSQEIFESFLQANFNHAAPLLARALIPNDNRPTVEELLNAVMLDISDESPDLAKNLTELSRALPK